MKKMLSILLLFFAFALTSHAQRNYAQEFINLMQQGRYFDLQDFYTNHAADLPANDRALELVYKSHLSQFLNMPDSAAICLEELFANHVAQIGPAIGPFYGQLFRIYDDQQRFKDGLSLCDKVSGYLTRNPFDLSPEFIRNEKHWLDSVRVALTERDANEPRIKMIRTGQGNREVKLNEGRYILFNADYNGVSLPTFFDTGVTEYLLMTKSLADKIGARIVDTKQSGIAKFNEVSTQAVKGVVDKLNLGNLELLNIPVAILENSLYAHLPDTLNDVDKSRVKTDLSDDQVFLGLPTMLLIGQMEVDWEKRTLSFPEDTKDIITGKVPNMYLLGRHPYMQLKVNGLPYTGYLDCGDDGLLTMEFPFYERNRESIQIDSTITKPPLNFYRMTGSFFNVPYEIVENPVIYSNGRSIPTNDSRVTVVNQNWTFNPFDGTVGVQLFQRLGKKVVLDFNKMRIEGRF